MGAGGIGGCWLWSCAGGCAGAAGALPIGAVGVPGIWYVDGGMCGCGFMLGCWGIPAVAVVV